MIFLAQTQGPSGRVSQLMTPDCQAWRTSRWWMGWQDCARPMILHGDGGVYTRKTESSILVVSMKSMLNIAFGKGLMPLLVLPKLIRRSEPGSDTAWELWEALIHQLNAAYHGEYRRVDSRNHPWPDESNEALLGGAPLCYIFRYKGGP